MKVTITIEDEELKGMKNDTVRAMAKLLTGKDFSIDAEAKVCIPDPDTEPVVKAEVKEVKISAPKKADKPAAEKQKPAKKAEPVKEAEPEAEPEPAKKAEPVKEAEPEAEPAAEKASEPEKAKVPERTVDELKKALKEFCTSHDGGAAKIQAKFKELGIKKASEATKEQLERVLKEVNE